MRKLLIFVIEGNSKLHNSDGKYIRATLDNFYSYDRYNDLMYFSTEKCHFLNQKLAT